MHPLTILVVNNDINYKQLLLTALEQIENVTCVGTASSSVLALRKIKVLQPDIVLLDMRLAEADIITIVQQLKQNCATAEGIIINNVPLEQSKRTLHLLQNIHSIPIIISQHPLNYSVEVLKHLIDTLYPIFTVIQNRSTHTDITTSPPIPAEKTIAIQRSINNSKNNYALCVIGISTGGPKALDYLIAQLNNTLQCPIIIVQHMPPVFTTSLAMKLNSETLLPVSEAMQGELLRNGHIYIAPGGKHLLLKKHPTGEFYFALKKTHPVNECRPSVDVLFHSVAHVFNNKVLAVIMTGMGRDGTEGVRVLKQKGATCLIQNQASSVVWGMPGSVYAAGLADEVIALDQLGTRINALLR